MPPLFIPPLIKVALGAAGVAAVAHWVAREVRRAGQEIDQIKVRATDRFRRETLPTLRRDSSRRPWTTAKRMSAAMTQCSVMARGL